MESKSHAVSTKDERMRGSGAPSKSRSMRCSMVEISVREYPGSRRRFVWGAIYSDAHFLARCLCNVELDYGN